MANEGANTRAAFYREFATEARAKAEAMKDFAPRRMMLQVAEMWEAMASRAEHDPKSN